MSSRRKAREAVLKTLYLSESRGISVDMAFDEMSAIDNEIAEIGSDPENKDLRPFSLGLDEKQKEFALTLARKIEENSAFDDFISDEKNQRTEENQQDKISVQRAFPPPEEHTNNY